MRVIHKLAVASTLMAALVAVGMGTALADPGTPPPLTTVVGISCPPVFTGSPTENTPGSLVHDYNAMDPTVPASCWDDVNPATGAIGDTITTKAAGSSDTSCAFSRPYGVDAEIAALNADREDGAGGLGQAIPCIDFVIADRGPNATSFKDTFVALINYALTWSYPEVSGQVSPQPASLTRAQLSSIYSCVDTNWDQVGGTSAPIVPVLPSVGTGVRDMFLAALGISASSEPCWVNGIAANGDPIEENTGLTAGNSDQFDQASSVDDIFPYSIGDFIAQGPAVHGTGSAGTPGSATVGGHATPLWAHGDLALGEIADISPVTTNSFGQPVINPGFPSQLYQTMYAVVRNGFTNPTSAANASLPTTPSYEASGLSSFFSWICTTEIADSDIVSYGLIRSGGCDSISAGD
ncbi:MAG TPA: hypothetical protein VMG38_26015 [Trebonia sp.]|nr:hypothetical protein [Trebonia sp.]